MAPVVLAAAVKKGDVLDFFDYQATVTDTNVTPKGRITVRFTSGSGTGMTTVRPTEPLTRWVDRPCGHVHGCALTWCLQDVA